MEPTVTDPKFRTYPGTALVKYTPWRSPGFAPVLDPCGEAGGQEPGASIHGFDIGAKGSDRSVLPETSGPSWPAGSVQEVSWSLYANHGGGYSYRLCPKQENLTEACFQRMPLDFLGDLSWVQFGDDVSNRTAIPALRVSVGTNPPGSQWTRNPIPACRSAVGSLVGFCGAAQFEPPLQDYIPAHPKFAQKPGLYGFGPGALQRGDEMAAFWTARFNFNIIDQVQIPANLPAGDYVLGFRWDCEETPQIWQNCADVSITASEVSV
jgi:hypothetical protein